MPEPGWDAAGASVRRRRASEREASCRGPAAAAARKNNASGTIAAAVTTAKPSIVACQPNSAMPRSKTAGQTIPAKYCPDEIKATAVPRRRSNQRLT